MVTTAVTGASGGVGRRLVARLERDDRVGSILALDLAPPGTVAATWEASPKVTFRRADVRDRGLARMLGDVDVLVHLAFIHEPVRDEERMRDINVFGTRNVFQAVASAGVSKLVYLSSAVVYGAHPDNDLPLTEQSRLRANPDLTYAEHKLEVEQWVWSWVEDHPEPAVTVLRPSILAGGGVDSVVSRQIEAPRFTAVAGHKPPGQFVHVDDVAAAILHAVHNHLPGAYNVSAEGWLSFDEMVATAGRRPLFLPEEVAFAVYGLTWQLGVGQAPAGQLHYLMHPWVVSVDKLAATGWSPAYSNREALAALVADHRDRLAVLGMSTSRSLLRAAGALGVVAVVLGVARGLWRRGAGLLDDRIRSGPARRQETTGPAG